MIRFDEFQSTFIFESLICSCASYQLKLHKIIKLYHLNRNRPTKEINSIEQKFEKVNRARSIKAPAQDQELPFYNNIKTLKAMSEREIENKLKEAKALERQLSIQNREIRNFLQYLRVSASDRSTFVPCCCARSQLEVSPSFHRAFKHLTRDQKVNYFHKIVNLLKNSMEEDQSIGEKQIPKDRTTTLFFFNEDESNWETRQIQINFSKKIFRFVNGGEQINFHHYILRNSKKKDKKSLALESTESMQVPATIRLSNYKESFQDLKQLLDHLIMSATKDKFKSSGVLPRQTQKQLKLHRDSDSKPALKQELLIKKTESIFESPLSKVKFQQQPVSFRQDGRMGEIQYQKLKIKLINSLTNYAELTEKSQNVFVDFKENRVRKIFYIKEEEYKIPLEWFGDNLMNCSGFRRWKKTLKTARVVPTLKKLPNQKIFYEEHCFQEKIQSSFLYKRERVPTEEEVVYFIDISALDPSLKLHSNNKIQYVVWKVERNANNLVITVEGKIQHQNTKLGNPSISLTQQFLGDIDKICTNCSMTLLGDSNFNINTVLFEELYISQLGQLKDFSQDDGQFYSIEVDNEEDHQGTPSTLIKIKHNEDIIPPSLKSGQSGDHMHSNNLLKWKHPTVPYSKPSDPKFITPKALGQNPFWQSQFRFNDKGDMVSINIKKLQAQKGILSQLLKTIGRNLFSGKSILNISLPVTVFSYQSNLSLLCKSFCYAPMLLEKASQAMDPVQRFKHVVAFALGCTTAYLQMDKPFNPILGQTYQCFVNGCPIYGEQTSHHPPISTLFMKGRGYWAYGSYEAKVNLSLNSATGSNEGITYISFDQNNFKKNIVKFTVPPGQISGLMWGERIIRAVDKTQYLDVDNMLFLQLQFGKHKGTTQFCKYHNGIQGKLVQLDNSTDITTFPKIKVKKVVRQIGIFSGKWSQVLYFEDDLVFNSWQAYPHKVQQYPCPLESDAFKRKDLLLRIEQNMQQAQTAKEELENIQRNDRKLRKKYTGRQQ